MKKTNHMIIYEYSSSGLLLNYLLLSGKFPGNCFSHYNNVQRNVATVPFVGFFISSIKTAELNVFTSSLGISQSQQL